MEATSPPPPPRTDRTQERTQRRGALIALGVAGVFVALIAYFIVFGGRPQVQQSGGTLTQPRPEDRPLLGTNNADGTLLAAQTVRVDMMDKKDPTRQAGQLLFARMDPLEARRYAVEKPEAWFYLTDGRSVYVRADSGRLYMPDRQKQPESGTVTGHVEIKMFAAKEKGASVDLAKDKPIMTLTTDSLAFESAVGEVSTPGLVVVLFEGGKFEGTDVSLVFNQPEERLERGEIRKGGVGRIFAGKHPKQDKPEKAASPHPSEVAAAPSAGTSPSAPAHAVVETLYRMILTEKVNLVQGQRRLDADKLQLMARLMNNQLPEGAIGEVKFAKQEQKDAGKTDSVSTPAGEAPSAVVADAQPRAQDASKQPAADSTADMVLSWSGPCVIAPLATTPPELKNDHVALRFTADQSGLVKLADSERGITGHAAAIEYSATTRSLSLIGPGPASVMLDVPESGRLTAVRMDADLAAGIVRTPGPGVLVSKQGTEDAQELSWAERGEFAFRKKNEELTNSLKSATMSGNVIGKGKGLKFGSQGVLAEFAEVAAPAAGDGRDQLVLSRTVLTGKAKAESADTGVMQGEKIDVAFDPPAEGAEGAAPRPRLVKAEGRVVVDRAEQHLASEFLEARLIDVGEPGSNKVDVGWFTARGGVEFASRKDFLTGTTQELTADLGVENDGSRRQLVDLIGSGTVLTRNQPGKEQGTIQGTQLHIDGLRGHLESFGVGEFHYTGPSKAAVATVDAGWTKRMVYDDVSGQIDCLGDSWVKYAPDPFTRNKVEGERVKVAITPAKPGQSVVAGFGDGAEKPEGKREEREVLTAEAFGSILDREGGANAKIESRSYAAEAAGEGDLQKLYYLEGPQISADNKSGLMDVPGAGRLLVMDKAAAAQPSAAPGTRDLVGGDSRGLSLFEWATSLHVERHPETATATMAMKDNVSVVHKALADGQVTEIRCADMTAFFKDVGGGEVSEAKRGLDLQNVTAIGSVYAASGPPKTAANPRPPVREIIAQRLDYDAILQRLDAKAAPGGIVTMFDPTMASPTTAAWLSYDIKKSSVEIKQPAGVAPQPAGVAPR